MFLLCSYNYYLKRLACISISMITGCYVQEKMGPGPIFSTLGVRSCFLLLLIQTQFILMHYIAYDPALFINGKRSVVESHIEDRKYLCRFHPGNEILKRLYEIIEISKKQDLTPPWTPPCSNQLSPKWRCLPKSS